MECLLLEQSNSTHLAAQLKERQKAGCTERSWQHKETITGDGGGTLEWQMHSNAQMQRRALTRLCLDVQLLALPVWMQARRQASQGPSERLCLMKSDNSLLPESLSCFARLKILFACPPPPPPTPLSVSLSSHLPIPFLMHSLENVLPIESYHILNIVIVPSQKGAKEGGKTGFKCVIIWKIVGTD